MREGGASFPDLPPFKFLITAASKTKHRGKRPGFLTTSSATQASHVTPMHGYAMEKTNLALCTSHKDETNAQ